LPIPPDDPVTNAVFPLNEKGSILLGEELNEIAAADERRTPKLLGGNVNAVD